MKNTSSAESSILEKFSSTDPDILREAAYDAAANGLAEAVPSLVALLESDNLGVQEAAENAVRRIRGAETVSCVAPLLRSDNAAVRNSAMDILREIGEDNMKVLAGLLEDQDADVRIFAADILGTSGSHVAVMLLSETLLHDAEVNVRYQAAVSLGTLGSPDAVPALRKAMKDEEWVQFAVVEALAKIRADSCLDILIQALPGSSGLVASTIVDALGQMNNLQVVPLLMEYLDKASGPLRNKAVKAVVQILGPRSLGLLSPREQETFKFYLIAALDGEDDDIAEIALLGLSGIGSSETTRAVLKYGVRLDPDKHPDMMDKVLASLAAMGHNAALAEALSEGDERLVRLALEVCRKLPGNEAVGMVEQVFWSLDRDKQRVAMDYLSREAGEAQIPFFLGVLDRDGIDGKVLKGALVFLGNRMRCAGAGMKMFSLLRHQYDDVKEVALEACIALNDPEVNAALAALFDESDPLLRMMGVYAMGQLGDPAYTAALTQALEDELPDIRKIALESLGRDPVSFVERLPLLARRLEDENSEVRLAVVDMLGLHDEREVYPLLVRTLEDQDDWVRIRAIDIFGRRHMAQAVPLLVGMLEAGNLLVTLKIVEALGYIGGKVSFRTLLGLMAHEAPEVQQAAAEAIARIREEQYGAV
jgi:HEAT repeat protein